VIVESVVKNAYLLSLSLKISMLNISHKEVVRLHEGMPSSIVLDWDPRFTFKF